MIIIVTLASPVAQKGTDGMAFFGHDDDPAVRTVPNATGDATRRCATN